MRPIQRTGCSVDTLAGLLREPFPPTLLDVRRRAAFERDPVRIPMSLRCEPEALAATAASLERWRPVVAWCVHGHEVSRDAARLLCERGFDATFLEGGIERWREAGRPVEPFRPPTQWVTRERPRIDRIACPWLVRRFIDASAAIHYVPPSEVRSFALAHDAVPFDIADVEYGHAGDACSFDAFVARHAPDDAPLSRLADIVRAADTDTLERAAEAPGLLAISRGLGRGLTDDAQLLHHGLLVYDALYAACSDAVRQ